MKSFFKLLIVGCIAFCFATIAKAQIVSVRATLSPGTSTLIGDASRIGYDFDQYSMFYMRYNDTAFFCSNYFPSYLNPLSTSVTSYKIEMPQDFVITDFKKFCFNPGFIGSYEGVGMYGWTLGYTSLTNNTFYFFKVPAVDRLKRIALVRSALQYPPQSKAFAIGEKYISSINTTGSYIMEFYAEGNGSWPYDPYDYASMPFDSDSNKKEIVDDVIIVEDYVVFATRDYRPTSLPVNLRISDTNDVLGNSDIDNQWGFYLYDYESIASEVRLLLLNKNEFVLAYVVYNSKYDNYHLCTHKINLSDFLQGVNTIISHEVEIDRRCSNLVDLIYEPDVQTMVILLNGENVSELYHADPFLTTTSTIYKLDHRGKSLYSIDTIGNYYLLNSDMYVAIGDSTLFYQDISNGSVIEESCLTITPVRYILQDQPEIEFVNDPLERYQGYRDYVPYTKVATYFYGTRTCRILDD